MSTARRVAPFLVAAALAVPVVGWDTAVQAAPKPTLRVFDATLTEGTGGQAIVAFAVQLSAKAPSAVSFTWGTKAGTALAGSDFTSVPAGTTGRIAKGATSTALVVRVAADAVDEYTETFGVHLAGVSSSVTLADADATATVLDDDKTPTLSVSPGQIVEGTDATAPVERTLTATLSQPSGKPVSVRYAVTSGTAEVGSDLLPSAGTLTFAPGVTTADITVDSDGDDADEPNRTFALSWAASVNVRVPARRTPVTLLDDDGPLRPSILGTTPSGPSPEAAPLVFGLAPAGSTVEVYRNGGCNGAPVATGSAEDFTGSGFAVPMALNVSNTLSVKGTDTVGGDDTECSPPFAYVHDDVAPDAPDDLRTVPDSPTQDPAPSLRGSVEAGSTVTVFLDTDCSGTPVATVPAATLQTQPGVPLLGLTPNVVHTVRAAATDAAGNVSACSAPLQVLVDTQAPAAPAGVHVVSGLPQGLDVVLGGTAEAGSTVELFVDQPCSGSVDGSGTAAALAGSGIALDDALPEGAHTVYARATDQAGNVGSCSLGVAVDVDRTPPAAPTALVLLGPDPTDQNTVRVQGDADAGSTVRIYRDTNGGAVSCDDQVGSGSAADLGDANGILVGPLPDGTHELHARAFDSVGNGSACSASAVTVTVDTVAPAPPTDLAAVGGSPTADATPTITGDAAGGSQIHLFVDDPDCSGTAAATGTDSTFEGPGIDLTDTLSDGSHDVTATATDAAGNESACSDPVDVVVDTTPPAAPVLAAVDYAASPFATGTAPGAATVTVFLSPTCSGPPLVAGPAATFTGAGLPLGTLDPGPYDLTARSEDDLGNLSDCSTSVPFVVP